ncbi:MAG: polyphenol oxidase family protein [Acidimicrobiales bacterium]
MTPSGGVVRLGGTGVAARWTSPADGDLACAVPLESRRARQRAVLDRPWSVARQVHGAAVAVIDGPGQAGGEADALVSSRDDVALAVLGADCATVALASEQGVLAAVHSGWRGLVAGVIEAAVQAMRSLGAAGVVGALGPCLHPCCGELSPDDLETVAGAVGPEVRAVDSRGRPALDLRAGARVLLQRSGVCLVEGGEEVCTRCSGRYYSHRGGSSSRQAVVVWRE